MFSQWHCNVLLSMFLLFLIIQLLNNDIAMYYIFSNNQVQHQWHLNVMWDTLERFSNQQYFSKTVISQNHIQWVSCSNVISFGVWPYLNSMSFLCEHFQMQWQGPTSCNSALSPLGLELILIYWTIGNVSMGRFFKMTVLSCIFKALNY